MDNIQRATQLRREIRELTNKKNKYTAVKKGLEEINSYLSQGNENMGTAKTYLEQEYEGKRVSGMIEKISGIDAKSTAIKTKVSNVLNEITSKIDTLSAQIRGKQRLLNNIDFMDLK